MPKTVISYGVNNETEEAKKRHENNLINILRQAGCDSTKVATYNSSRGDHSVSTCRMSKSPTDGVVDQDLKVHDTDNLYVCSNAVFPNGGAVNPTLTLAALTLRLADHLGDTK